MAKLKFWNAEEVKALIKTIESAKTVNEGIKQYAEQSGRTEKAVSQKYYYAKKVKTVAVKRGRPAGSKNKNPLNTSTQRGIDLPTNFVFNFTPKKAEMYDNHVRLYF